MEPFCFPLFGRAGSFSAVAPPVSFQSEVCPAVGSSFFGDGADVGDGECCGCVGYGGGLFAESVGAPFAGSGAGSFYR